MSGNLFQAFENANPDASAPFLLLSDGRRLSHGEMRAQSARYANLLCDLGIGRGDRVAIQTDKHPECLWLYLACLRTGAVYLPLNPAYTEAEIAYFAGDAEPVLFVCEAARREALAAALQSDGGPAIETLGPGGTGSLAHKAASRPNTFATVALAGDDLAAILYTSGTTGRSKGAMISHENLRSNAAALVDTWRFTADDVLLHALPVFHTHGLFVATNTVLLCGGSMIFLPKFDIDDVMAALPDATAMMGVPTYYARLLSRDDFTAELVRHMRVFISGSAPLSPQTHRAFERRTGHAILERYGMTETNMITSNPYDGVREPGTVGFALPGVSIRIADPQSGDALPPGEIGVVELSGPNVFRGYWRMPDKTAEEFRPDGYFITGDLGSIDETGRLTITGREKDLIITGGLNVYPAEVEALLDARPEVAESAVIGVPHADFGEAVTAVVVASGGAGIDEAALLARLSETLARFKVPKKIVVADELPRNAMGKVRKNRLRERYNDLIRVGIGAPAFWPHRRDHAVNLPHCARQAEAARLARPPVLSPGVRRHPRRHSGASRHWPTSGSSAPRRSPESCPGRAWWRRCGQATGWSGRRWAISSCTGATARCSAGPPGSPVSGSASNR